MTGEPLGLPRGSVRAVMSVAVVLVAGAIAAVLLIFEPSSDLTKMVVGGWATALGNVIGFYFGSRSTAE
ncbi:MAG: hypothetical protein IIA90_04755 [Chloroflexi bacterium]|nr:hypothetical protein [Chloroflexota bacterium]